jgi:hypothetical protein
VVVLPLFSLCLVVVMVEGFGVIRIFGGGVNFTCPLSACTM